MHHFGPLFRSTLIFVSLFTSVGYAATPITSTSPLIMIDPGHGGNDGGATYENAIESKIVFKLAEKLVHQLKQNNINAILTRTSDMQLNLAARVKKAEEAQVQLFVSLHANAAPQSTVRGFEIFLYTPTGKSFQKKSKDISQQQDAVQTIISDLQNQTRFFQSLKTSEEFSQRLDGPLKSGDFYVLRKAKIPAVLVEVGFLSNPRDRARLQKDEYQDQLSIKMAEALLATTKRLDLESKERLRNASLTY